MGQLVTPEAFPFIGPTNLEYSPVTDAERCINLYYEPSYQGRNQPSLVGTPGLSTPFQTLAQTPVRALVTYGGQAISAVGGTHTYNIDTNGTILKDIAIPNSTGGALQCRFAVNGRAAVMLFDPSVTGGNQNLFFVDYVAGTATAKLQAIDVAMLDGFFVAIAAGASLNANVLNQLNVSAFLDGTTWPALAFVEKTGTNDNLVGLGIANNLLWVFGTKNTEIWYNAGLPNFPFARINGGTINFGCYDRFTIVNLANTLLWLGNSPAGSLKVYMANGLVPVPVSTPAIEQLINKALRTASSSNVQVAAFGYEEAGHIFYVLNILGAVYPQANTGLTLVYDLTTKMWHERSFWNAGTPIMGLPWVGTSWNPTTFFGTKVYVGNFPGVGGGTQGTQGAIYQMGLQFASDNGSAIQRKRISSHVTDGLRWVKYPYFEVHGDIGSASMTLLYSNDGGQTFPSLLRPDATIAGQTPANTLGTYKQFRWRQLGRARKRAMGITILDSTNTPIVIERAQLRATMGTEI